MSTSLKDSSVLLLGATGGIGSALATELSIRQAKLCCVGKDKQKLNALEVEADKFVADLRSPKACEDSINFALSSMSKIDVVINATGVVAFGAVADLSIDVMEELFLVNVFIPIMVAKLALNQLEDNGAIVNISGIIAEKNMPGMAAYGAAKAALRSFDEGFAREARRIGIRVLDVRPPHTESGLADHPIEGTAPKMPAGVSTQKVATVICDSLESGSKDLPSDDFI